MTEAGTPFQALAAYWPARSGMYFWEYFDRDEIARDFDAAVSLGLTDFTLALLWQDFQPDRDRVAVESMRRLEQVLDLAAGRSVSLLPILFPAEIAALLWLPSWALSPGAPGARQVVSGHHLSHWEPFDLFSDPRMVEAETRLVREVIGAFADHPAADGWVLGDHLAQASAPASAAAFEEWLGTMAEAAHPSGHQPALWLGVAGRDVVQSRRIDPSALGRLGIGALLTAGWEPSWARGAGREWRSFLAGYTTRLVGSPVITNDVGVCTVDPALVSARECVGQGEAARLAEDVVTAVRAGGGGGVSAAALLDFSPGLARSTPFRENPAELTRGLLFADRRPKDTAQLWSAVRRDRPVVLPVPDQIPPVDPEDRMHDPEGVARACFEQFNR